MVDRQMLVIFDVEGVLLNAEYLPVLAELRGPEKMKEIWDITKAGINGDIVWEEGLRRRVHALRGIDYDRAKEIGENLPIMPGAKELCTALKNSGWKTIAVSGGFTIITDRLKKDLGIDQIFSNELVFNENGLQDVIINVTSNKAVSVLPTVKAWGIKKEDTVAVVDGANDLKLFDISGFRVGFCPVDIVRDRADEVVQTRDLSLVMNLLRKKYGKNSLSPH